MPFNSNTEVAIQKLIEALKNNEDLRKISAAKGSKLYNLTDGTSYQQLDVKSIYIREDTTFDTINGFNDLKEPIDFLVQFNITSQTLIQGDLLIVPDNWIITEIQLDSGSIIAYS